MNDGVVNIGSANKDPPTTLSTTFCFCFCFFYVLYPSAPPLPYRWMQARLVTWFGSTHWLMRDELTLLCMSFCWNHRKASTWQPTQLSCHDTENETECKRRRLDCLVDMMSDKEPSSQKRRRTRTNWGRYLIRCRAGCILKCDCWLVH